MCAQEAWHLIAPSGGLDGGLSLSSPDGSCPSAEAQGARKDVSGIGSTPPVCLPGVSSLPCIHGGGERSPWHLGLL